MNGSCTPDCYLCLDFEDWPTQRLQVEQPALRGRMIVVTTTDRRRGTCVAACCAQAAQRGIRPGMPMAEAASLLQPSGRSRSASLPPLHLEPLNEAADRSALEQLGQQLYQFASWVGYPAEGLPHSLFLEIHRTAPLWGGEGELAGQVGQAVRQWGYRAAIAGAVSPSAAWTLARFAGQPGESPRLVAPGDTRQALAALPVEALRVKDATVQLLKQLGLVQLGQLWELPRAALAPRFGDELLRRLDQLLGRQPEVIPACPWPQPSSVEREIDPPTDRREPLEKTLYEMLRQLTGQLQAQGQGLVVLEVVLACAEGDGASFQVGVYRPTADEGLLEKLLQLRLESLKISSPVRQVRLDALVKVPLAARQEAWWQPGARLPAQMETLVNRLSSRLGSERVLRPAWQGGIVPERACRWIAWTGQQAGRAIPAPTRRDLPPRPLWLCQPPQPIQVEMGGGEPVGLWEGNRKLSIRRAWGPERLETGWWRGASQQRDYYRIELQDGRRWWLFRRRTDGKWFLHGYFG